ncbi:MAG: 3-oxoacyl-[acyl-carrier-protein] reductase [Pirellulales bacterium]|jgi:3-oxoacyl-[acyl-carrier protein] reductase|nr:3-oxoacyl-[acyl-carrier-protein] reductase [Pirellulales bacterium]
MSDETNRRIQVDLSGKRAMVTGASRGIGKSIAVTLGAAGATVVCIARNQEKLQETADIITQQGGTAEVYPCDVVDTDAVQNLFDKFIEKWERLDILVNNAGITRDTLLPRMSDEEWDDVLSTNLRSVFLFSRAASQVMMRARTGRIINISSVSGRMGNPGQANYSASKAGIIGFTQTVARELASRKVTVNAICPGFVATEMTDAMGPAVLDEVKKRVPAKRLGTCEEISDAVLYLASDSALYITGQVLTLDGGLTA